MKITAALSVLFIISLLIVVQIPIKYNVKPLVSNIETLDNSDSTNFTGNVQINEQEQDQWWKHWSRDANRNKIDDVIEYKIKTGEYANIEKVTVIVDYDHKPNKMDIQNLDAYGAEVVYVSKYMNTIIVCIVLEDVFKLTMRPEIVMIEDNTEFTVTLDKAVPSIGVDKVWKILKFNGTGVTIAIMDTGIDAGHASLDDLDDNPKTNDPKVIGWYDTINHDPGPYDDNGHGTHVSGIAAGTGAPAHKYIGVAPGANLVGVKVLNANGVGTSVNIAIGVEWVISNKDKYHVKVMSLSLGSIAIPFVNNDGKSILSRLLDNTMKNEGIVVVSAAGNEGPLYGTINPPGDAEHVITVGSVNNGHVISTFSSRGPAGGPIHYIKPDVCAPGEYITSAAANSGNGYVAYSGTSMATPMVSGMVALVLQAKSSLTTTEVKDQITKNADNNKKFNAQRSPNNDYGWGVVNAYVTVKAVIGG